MNDESSEIVQSADPASLSLSSRLRKTLLDTKSSLQSGFTVTTIANVPPVDGIAMRVPDQEATDGGSKRLLAVGIGLITSGALTTLVALRRRRRPESLVVTPVESVTAPAESIVFEEPSVAAPESLISKKVVAQDVSFAVPVSHDEVFVDRRPIGESAVMSLTPIGQADEVQIPLGADRLEVQKEIVVTDEFALDASSIDGIARVSESLRPQETHVYDATEGRRPPPTDSL